MLIFNSNNVIVYQNALIVIISLNNKVYKLHKISLTHGLMPSTLRELSCAKRINYNKKINSNIVKVHSIEFCSFNDELWLALVMDLCATFENYKNINAFYEILNGVKYLNDLGYVHGDLSPPNIMSKNDSIRLIDFGHSQKKYRKYDYNSKPAIHSRPLEINLNSNKLDINTIDSFSLGNIYYKFLMGSYIVDYSTVSSDTINKRQIINSSLTNKIIKSINIKQLFLTELGGDLKPTICKTRAFTKLDQADRKIIGKLVQHNSRFRATTYDLIKMLPQNKLINSNININNFTNLTPIRNIGILHYYEVLTNLKCSFDIIYNILYNLVRLIHNDIDQLFWILYWVHNKIVGNFISVNKMVILSNFSAEVLINAEIIIFQNNNFNLDPFNALDFILEFPSENINKFLIQFIQHKLTKYDKYSELFKVLHIHNKFNFKSDLLENLKINIIKKLNIIDYNNFLNRIFAV
jgi:serine/threonine protein kinase